MPSFYKKLTFLKGLRNCVLSLNLITRYFELVIQEISKTLHFNDYYQKGKCRILSKKCYYKNI